MLKLEKILAGTALAAVLAIFSAQNGHAGFDEAVKAYEAGNYTAAYEEWLPLAKSNDPAAMRNVGHLYRRGLGVDQDYAKAMSWYKRAANMGFDRAQANVATMYLKGEGVEQDYSEASKWFSKAARNGHTIAQYNLGLMYEHGKGVPKSASKALGWYNLAAKAGHKQALDKLSVLIARDPQVQEEKPETSVKEPVVVTQIAPSNKVKTVAKPVSPAVPEKPVPEKPVVAKTKPSVVKVEKTAPAVATETTASKVAPVKIATPEVATPKIITPIVVAPVVVTPKVASQKITTPKAVVVEKPVQPEKSVATVEKPAVAASQPVAVTQQAEKNTEKWDPFANSANNAVLNGETDKLKKEETTGFFAALKSLMAGDDDETATSQTVPITAVEPAEEKSAALKMNTPVTPTVSTPKAPVVAMTPATTQTAPAASSSAVSVVNGNGLTLSEQLEMADLAFTLEEYQQALNVWAPLAQKGNAVAQYNLGNMFLGGHAVPVDRVRAYFWWQKAQQNGSTKAASSLAELEKTLTFLEKRQLKRAN